MVGTPIHTEILFVLLDTAELLEQDGIGGVEITKTPGFLSEITTMKSFMAPTTTQPIKP